MGHFANSEQETGLVDAVVAYAANFAANQAVTPEQRRLLALALESLRSTVAEWGGGAPPFISVPLLVYAGCTGQKAPAIPVAAAAALLFEGLDLFDDIADGDHRPEWKDHSAAQANLTAATLLCSVPQLLIAELDAAPAVLAGMHRTIASGLLNMAAGQQSDLTSAGATQVDPSLVQTAVMRKSGEELAMFARLAAEFAGAPAGVADAYAEFARCTGTAGQIASDCHELFDDPSARDLAHGARTLPIALYLNKLWGAERAAFLDLLERARGDESAREQVRNSLRRSGVLSGCAFVVETYCQRALRYCDMAAPAEPFGAELRAAVRGMSFFAEPGQYVPGDHPAERVEAAECLQ